MYKNPKKSNLESSKQPLVWLKRKCIILITAFMLGMSNGLNQENNSIIGNQHHTEQKHKKE